jgi:hypothetical protein
MERVSTRASIATRVAQSGRNFGRASERYVSQRPQCGEQEMARAVGPAIERLTTCHCDHGWHGAGHVQGRVTAPGPRSRRSRRRPRHSRRQSQRAQ